MNRHFRQARERRRMRAWSPPAVCSDETYPQWICRHDLSFEPVAVIPAQPQSRQSGIQAIRLTSEVPFADASDGALYDRF
jgi:hypothetical protein